MQLGPVFVWDISIIYKFMQIYTTTILFLQYWKLWSCSYDYIII